MDRPITCVELLEETFELHQLIPTDEQLHIVADGGAENKGEVDQYIAKLGERVIKLTAKQPEFPHSNSMVESGNHLFKNVFLKNRPTRDGQQLSQRILAFMYWNDHHRYPVDLMGYTPYEVRQGKRPEKGMFTQQIEEARKQRHLDNKKAGLCGICS